MSPCILGKICCFFSIYQPSTVDRVHVHIEVCRDQLECLDTQGTLCLQPSNVCSAVHEYGSHYINCEDAHNIKCR